MIEKKYKKNDSVQKKVVNTNILILAILQVFFLLNFNFEKLQKKADDSLSASSFYESLCWFLLYPKYSSNSIFKADSIGFDIASRES